MVIFFELFPKTFPQLLFLLFFGNEVGTTTFVAFVVFLLFIPQLIPFPKLAPQLKPPLLLLFLDGAVLVEGVGILVEVWIGFSGRSLDKSEGTVFEE